MAVAVPKLCHVQRRGHVQRTLTLLSLLLPLLYCCCCTKVKVLCSFEHCSLLTARSIQSECSLAPVLLFSACSLFPTHTSLPPIAAHPQQIKLNRRHLLQYTTVKVQYNTVQYTYISPSSRGPCNCNSFARNEAQYQPKHTASPASIFDKSWYFIFFTWYSTCHLVLPDFYRSGYS